MRPRARRHARQATTSGVTFEQRGSVENLWQVMERTFKKHGTPPRLQNFNGGVNTYRKMFTLMWPILTVGLSQALVFL